MEGLGKESVCDGLVRDCISPERLGKWYWERRRSVPEIAKTFRVGPQHLYELMRQRGIPRRSGSEVNYLTYKDKPQFQWKEKLAPEQKRLQTAGLMLYWAEGAKQGDSVDLSNTDPKLILVFLGFLRQICGVAESRLRGYIFIYEGQDAVEIRRYWSKLTRIPEGQFQKPYVSRFRPNRNHQNVFPYGVFHVRYNDKRLHHRILDSARHEADAFLLSWADAGVVNRDAL